VRKRIIIFGIVSESELIHGVSIKVIKETAATREGIKLILGFTRIPLQLMESISPIHN
jgi:hypothetical protein